MRILFGIQESHTIASLASVGKGVYGLAKNASPALIAGNLVSTPLVTGSGEPTTFDESTMANIPGSAFYRGKITSGVESGGTLMERVDDSSIETGAAPVYSGPWAITVSYPGTSLRVQENYNLDTGFQPINVYHAADGNTYKDTGEYESLGRRYFRGISTSGATIFTGRVIGPDGTDNWVDIGSDGNSPFSRLQNISTGQVVHSTHTEGDAIFVDNPNDNLVFNTHTNSFQSTLTGKTISTTVALHYADERLSPESSFTIDEIRAGSPLPDGIHFANKYPDKSKAKSISEENSKKNLDNLNRNSNNKNKNDNKSNTNLSSGLYSVNDRIKKVYNSLKELKSLPKGFKSYQKDKLNIKNEDGLGKQLKEDVGGDWKKIYDHGKDINGNDIEIHYFQNRNGQIFNPKIKRINDEPVNRKLK